MEAARTSAMQQAQTRTTLCRAITAHPTPSIDADTNLFRQIVTFFDSPDLFAGTTSIERQRRHSTVRNENGVMPLVELYIVPQNVRIWSFIER